MMRKVFLSAIAFSTGLLLFWFCRDGIFNPALAQAGANEWTVVSPDGRVKTTVKHLNQELIYQVERQSQGMIEESSLGLTMQGSGGDFTRGLSFVSEERKGINETYSVKAGKKAVYTNSAQELTLKFLNNASREIELIIRAYNDGVAYRYHLPGSGTAEILSEASEFQLPTGTTVWAQTWTDNYENEYYQYNLAGLGAGRWAFPLLAKLNNHHWALLTEAAVFGTYGGSHLNHAGSGLFKLSFAPDQIEPLVTDLPLLTPWRVIILGPDLSDLVESNLVENLNPPAEIIDDAWIEPGRVAWSWWSDPESPADLNKQKEYVDFAAEMGWEYLLIDEGWKENWAAEIVSYAQPRGVGIILWFAWYDLTDWSPDGWIVSETKTRSQFQKLKNWGVRGVKIDFMNSDSQERMKFYDLISRLAGEYQLMVNFHGSTKPAGERRRWPHLLTREAVKGAEYYKVPDKKHPDAQHNTTLPFTRNVIGPMDYTPVTFSDSDETTAAHQLALAIVFESPWQHLADSPDSYRASVTKNFLKIVPATWDEVKFIDGYPGQFVALARKKGSDWFIGAINAAVSREIQIPLSFLEPSSYQATSYQDGALSGEIEIEERTVTSDETLSFSLKANGGAAIYFHRGISLPTPTPPTCAGSGDIDCDSDVDKDDALSILANWLSSFPIPSRADVNGDGKVNGVDFGQVIKGFTF